MTTLPRRAPMSTLTRVSSRSESSSSSSSNPGARRRGFGSLGARSGAPWRARDGLLDSPHREALVDDALGERLLEGAVRGAEQRTSMARGDAALADEALNAGRQLEEAQRVRDRDPAAADPGRQLVVGQAEVFDQLLVGAGLFEWAEVLAVQVLDEGLLDGRQLVGIVDQRGDRRESGSLRGAPPSLTRDELVAAVPTRPDEHGLDHADLAHRGGQGDE